MKNKFIALALVTLSIVTTTVSCTTNEDFKEKAKAEYVGEKANVTMDLKTDNGSNPTGKTVNRGSLHAWISEIDITVKSNDFTYAPFMTPFMLTNLAVGSTSGTDTVEGSYNLSGVALGSNDFTVVTKTNTPQILSFESTTMTPSDRMTLLKTKNPYAIYNASILGQTIVQGANTLPQTMLTTQHGRACGVFTLSDALKSLGVTAKVTIAPSILMPSSLPVVTVNNTNNASLYLSNAQSTGGKILSFTVELMNANGVVYKTLATNMTLAASTSVNTIFTINDGTITTNTATDVFTAQPWDNQDGNTTIE